jgi:hypothetical protein
MSSKLNFGQSEVQHGSFNLPVNKETVVRFFYLPANDYLHPALFFRVAGTNSSRLNTAPITNHGGRTPYISIEEMQALIKLLDSAGLSWRTGSAVEVPKAVDFKETTGQLEIKIFSSGGTALSLSDPKGICETLAPLDAAFKQPRALWEFQLFRVDYNCKVTGFNRNAFPEHDAGKR